MEESVWLYFGIVAVLVALGVLLGVLKRHGDASDGELFFQGIEQLGAQADLVCASPLSTMLSLEIEIPSGARVSAQDDRLCGELGEDIRCVRSSCLYANATVLDLRSQAAQGLFRSHAYRCTALNDGVVRVTCEG